MPKKSSSRSYQKPTTIQEAYSNYRYRGKIVIESPEGLYSTTKEENAVKVFKRLEKKYPDNPPVSTVIPKEVTVTVSF